MHDCLGNLRVAFQKACEAAKIRVGRKGGGLVWHCTRNTAATDLAAAGCTIEDLMAVGAGTRRTSRAGTT